MGEYIYWGLRGHDQLKKEFHHIVFQYDKRARLSIPCARILTEDTRKLCLGSLCQSAFILLIALYSIQSFFLFYYNPSCKIDFVFSLGQAGGPHITQRRAIHSHPSEIVKCLKGHYLMRWLRY